VIVHFNSLACSDKVQMNISDLVITLSSGLFTIGKSPQQSLTRPRPNLNMVAERNISARNHSAYNQSLIILAVIHTL
jgi:hypothetical protein